MSRGRTRAGSKNRYFASSKIKQYALGVLFILLAGFIMTTVNYLISIVPESSIPESSSDEPVTNPYLITSMTMSVNGDSYFTNLPSPFYYTPQYTFYIVVDTSGLSPSVYAKQIRLHLSNGDSLLRDMTKYSDTVSYLAFDLAGRGITAFQVYFNGTASGNAVISFYDTSDIIQALTWAPPPKTTSISNKLILSFISWISGIMLVVIALHKFDIVSL